MHDLWTVQTGYNLGTYQEKVPTTINLPIANADTIIKISGTIPAGMRLENDTITGTPFQVSRSTQFEFCLRASHQGRIQDRTFNISIEGPDAPVWITPSGSLPIGENNQLFILDSSYVDYQLEAIDADLSANTVLEYYIPEGGGELPPGITLSSSGKLSGVIDPIYALDINAGTGFYDSNDYASAPFDFGLTGSLPVNSFYFDVQEYIDLYNEAASRKTPKKLNRYYQFTVNVTDGDSIATRTFRIFVVGDDFLRADNTIMQVGTGVFTSDGTYLRNPQWLTPSDIGYRRANNYITIYLELYDPNTVPGKVSYILESTNDDNSKSELPIGTSLDSGTGEIAGRVPYQPAITKEYKFTVSAVRSGTESDLVTVNVIPYEDQQQGVDTIKVQKLPLGLQDGINDLQSLVNQTITINDVDYKILGVDDEIEQYDILTLNKNLTADDLLVFTGSVYTPASIKAGSPVLITPANNEIFVYGRVSKDKYKNRVLRLNGNEYTIEDIQTVLNEGQPADQNISANAIEKLVLNIPHVEAFVNEQNISIAAFKGITSTKDFLVNSSDTAPKSTKTFSVKILGEVDSTITWITDSDLGTINANLMSHLKLEATSTVEDAKMKYILTDGVLPPGISLTLDGELIGSINQYSDGDLSGITVFDSRATTFDGGTTTIDKKFSFTVVARDRYGFSSVSRTFTLGTAITDTATYTDLYVQPLLKENQRDYFKTFISDPNIFDVEKIYRPSDKHFGIQKKLRMLLYSGIEKKHISNYVTALSSNHKRRRFNFGSIKTAVAKYPGTNNVAYEVVYADVIDSQDSTVGNTNKTIKILPQNKVKVNQTQIEVTDDTTKFNVGGSTYNILTQDDSPLTIQAIGDDIEVLARTGRLLIDIQNGQLLVDVQNGPDLIVGTISQSNADPYRFRPKGAVIKVDSTLIKASASDDDVRYISNVTNMRDKISLVGATEGGFLPLWMRTAQSGSLVALGYTTAVPLCFCKPGESESIALAIKNSDFDIKNINFEIDRYIIEGSDGNNQEQYLLFPNYQYNI